jgi:hypothetical protein
LLINENGKKYCLVSKKYVLDAYIKPRDFASYALHAS